MPTYPPVGLSSPAIVPAEPTYVAVGPNTPAQTLDVLQQSDIEYIPDSTTANFEPFWFNQPDLEWPFLIFDEFRYLDLELPHDLALEHPLVKIWQNDFESNALQGVTPSGRMWYSGRPNSSVYPPEILRVFLGLFRKHIPSTFALFAQPETHFASYYTLAAAALGGLFSSVSGSRLVANSLYNDARRLLAEQVSWKPV